MSVDVLSQSRMIIFTLVLSYVLSVLTRIYLTPSNSPYTFSLSSDIEFALYPFYRVFGAIAAYIVLLSNSNVGSKISLGRFSSASSNPNAPQHMRTSIIRKAEIITIGNIVLHAPEASSIVSLNELQSNSIDVSISRDSKSDTIPMTTDGGNHDANSASESITTDSDIVTQVNSMTIDRIIMDMTVNAMIFNFSVMCAPQIGVFRRIIAFSPKVAHSLDGLEAIINPEVINIEEYSDDDATNNDSSYLSDYINTQPDQSSSPSTETPEMDEHHQYTTEQHQYRTKTEFPSLMDLAINMVSDIIDSSKMVINNGVNSGTESRRKIPQYSNKKSPYSSAYWEARHAYNVATNGNTKPAFISNICLDSSKKVRPGTYFAPKFYAHSGKKIKRIEIDYYNHEEIITPSDQRRRKIRKVFEEDHAQMIMHCIRMFEGKFAQCSAVYNPLSRGKK